MHDKLNKEERSARIEMKLYAASVGGIGSGLNGARGV